MALANERIRSILESLFLVSNEPLTVARLLEVIQAEDAEVTSDDVKKALDAMVQVHDEAAGLSVNGFSLEEFSGSFQYRTRPENAPFVRRFLAVKPQRLTRAALETLAVIAYRQPVTKPDIERVRGVDVGATLKALLDRDLVRIMGKKEELGRPILYATTKRFLELFGLRSLAALPTLREYQELDENHQKQVDELYETERREPLVSDLAATAEFLMHRENEPELDELDEALVTVDRAHRQITGTVEEN